MVTISVSDSAWYKYMNTPSNSGLASVPAVTQYLRAAEALGVDYEPLLTQVGIDRKVLTDINKHISSQAMENLLALLIEASGDPCFGLRSAQFVEPASYSVLGYISMNCSSLRMIQAKIPMYEKIVGDMGVTSVEVSNGMVLQRWSCHFKNALVRQHEVENVLASWCLFAQRFLNFKGWHSVWFEHSGPSDPMLVKEYTDVFDCEVLFNQPASGFRFLESALDELFPQANERLLQMLLDHATTILANLDQSQVVAQKVKNLLRLVLKQRTPSSGIIAEMLGMSSRTLQRKLGEEGTSYKDLLNELRVELALYYLQNTDLSLESIAYQLGYAEARSFYRGFKQWTGRTAGSYR
jgi:AraC-like DNA-binding protein